MNEYHKYVYEHATYLTSYKLYKLLHDFTIEETIALDYLKHKVVYVESTGIERKKACEMFMHQINLVVVYAQRSYELIVAQAGIYIPFDIETAPTLIDAWTIKKERITKQFNQYFSRSINLVLRDGEGREAMLVQQANMHARIKALDTHKNKGDGMDAQKFLNDGMDRVFDRIRKVIMVRGELRFVNVAFVFVSYFCAQCVSKSILFSGLNTKLNRK